MCHPARRVTVLSSVTVKVSSPPKFSKTLTKQNSVTMILHFLTGNPAIHHKIFQKARLSFKKHKQASGLGYVTTQMCFVIYLQLKPKRKMRLPCAV